VIREIEAGATYTVTRRGVPVAQSGPLHDDSGPPSETCIPGGSTGVVEYS
jgi:antitoxin (DNA-binding transcriptional repressor) of toxin-antitoxin stability system